MTWYEPIYQVHLASYFFLLSKNQILIIITNYILYIILYLIISVALIYHAAAFISCLCSNTSTSYARPCNIPSSSGY
jgi:hypothetical protein